MISSLDQNPFQRLSACDAMSRAFSLLFRRLDIFLPIGLICYIPIVAFTISLLQFVGSSMATLSQSMATDNSQQDWGSDANNNKDSDALNLLGSDMSVFLGQFLVEVLLLQFVSILAQGAIVYAVAGTYAQQQITFIQSLKQGCSRWCDLYLAGFLVSIALLFCHLILAASCAGILSISKSLLPLVYIIYLAYLFFVCYVFVSLMILAPAIIVEKKTGKAVILRCMELAKGKRCYIFCTTFCIIIVNYLMQMILALILGFAHEDGSNVAYTSPILYCMVTTLTTFLYIPLIGIMETVVYFNIRVEKEGMNLEVLNGELGIDASFIAEVAQDDCDGKDDTTYVDSPSESELV